MSPKWLTLAFCLCILPSVVVPQISPGTILRVLCIISHGVFRLNACKLYDAPPERECTGLFFQCSFFDILPYGLCPLFRVCCNNGADEDGTARTLGAYIKNRKRSTPQIDSDLDGNSIGTYPEWLRIIKLNQTRSPLAPFTAAKIWQATFSRPGHQSATKLNGKDLNKKASDSVKILGMDGKLLKETASSVASKLTQAQKLLLGRASYVGKTIATNDFQVKAGIAVDTLSKAGKHLVSTSSDALANSTKAMLGLMAGFGERLTPYEFKGRGKRSTKRNHYSFIRELVEDKYGELSPHDEVPIQVLKDYTKDWPSDETDTIAVESALVREYKKLMVEIDMANVEKASLGEKAILKIGFDEFRSQVLGLKGA